MESRIKALLAATVGGVIAGFLFLAYATVPLIGIPGGLLAPLSISYASLRWGRSAGFVACLVGTAVVLGFDGIHSSLIFLVQAGILALLLTEGLKRELGGARSLLLAVGGAVIAGLLLVAAWYGGQGMSLSAEIGRGIDTSTAQTLKLYEQADIPPEVQAQMKEGVAAAGRLLRETWPSLAVMGLMLMAGLNLLLLRRLLPQQVEQAGVGRFVDFRTPDHLVWLLLIAGFARLAPPPLGGSWSLNLLMVVSTLYFLQGLAVFLLFISRSSMAAMLRVFFFMLLLFQPYLVIAVAALGLFDLWGNFRIPRQTQNL
jgi:hypothetical protein